MSDWIRTKAGLQMAETIVRQLPKLVERLLVLEVRMEEFTEKVDDIVQELKTYNRTALTEWEIKKEEILRLAKRESEIITFGDKKLKDYGPPYGPQHPTGKESTNEEQNEGSTTD